MIMYLTSLNKNEIVMNYPYVPDDANSINISLHYNLTQNESNLIFAMLRGIVEKSEIDAVVKDNLMVFTEKDYAKLSIALVKLILKYYFLNYDKQYKVGDKTIIAKITEKEYFIQTSILYKILKELKKHKKVIISS